MAPPLTMNNETVSIVHTNSHTDYLDSLPLPSSSSSTHFIMSLYHSHPPSSTTPRLSTDDDGLLSTPIPSSTPLLSSSASTTSTTSSSSYSFTHSSHGELDSILLHEHFYSHLQTSTSLLRIVLRRSLPATLMADQWYQLKLEVRDEFGMTLEGQRAKSSTMHLTCELLEQQTTGHNHAVYLATDWKVEWRPLHYDAWESTEDISSSPVFSGFDGSGTGGLEFNITRQQQQPQGSNGSCTTTLPDTSMVPPTTSATHFYLRMVPTFEAQQTIHALPLVVGPFSVIPATNWTETTATTTATTTTTTTTTTVTVTTRDHTIFGTKQQQGNDINASPSQLYNINCYSQNMYRAFNLNGTSQYFMIKEGWDLGTPGKMWDSALMISDMFAQKIIQQPDCLENCHLLDLSAGTGATGLLIYFIYKHMFPGYRKNMKITLTDLPEALPLIHYNRQLNGIAATKDIQVTPLRWGELENVWRIKKKAPIDIIIASDVLYEPTQFAALMKSLIYLAEPGRTVIYLGYKRRGLKESDEQYFFDLCCSAFDMESVGYGSGDHDEATMVTENDDNRIGDDNGAGNDNGADNDTLNGNEEGSFGGGHGITNNKQSKMGWEKRYGKLVRNATRINGEGWLGSYAKKWQEESHGNSNNSNNNSDMSNQGFEGTGVQIYRLVRKQEMQ